VYWEQQFLRLCRHTWIMGRQHQQRGTMGENQHWQKDIIHWEELFRKTRELQQHKWQDSRTQYSSWRPFFHKNCPMWASQIQHYGKAAIAKPLITESNAQIHKWWCYNHKTWTLGNWKHVWYDQMSHPSWCSLHQEELTFGEDPRKPTIQIAWFQQ
jgi:hypothetical protein